MTVVVAAAVGGLLAAAFLLRHPGASGAPSAEEVRDELMGLTPLGGRPAPDFTLIDQAGRRVSLDEFTREGRDVVLEFMDPRCVDICPIVAQEFRYAYDDLGAAAARVEFVAIDANPYHTAVADVMAFTRDEGLAALPDWEFVTGPLAALRRTWSLYGVAVQAPSPTSAVEHSDEMYFVDANGSERWVAVPIEDHTAAGTAYLPLSQVKQWGGYIAGVTRQMLG